jgi:hypothetical protein
MLKIFESWDLGAMEIWSVEKNNQILTITPSLHYSTTPILTEATAP